MANINYMSTRGAGSKISASEAIIKGLADDGGLYMPTDIPSLDKSIDELCKMNYQEVAYEVMKLFFTDFTEDELKACINGAYDEKFNHAEIAPLVKKGDDFYLELFHGATIAFKDMALSILPYLMKTAAKKIGIKNEIVILTATSGDTGKAALAGFANVEGIKIIVFYPKDGVSPIQKHQMVSQEGDNTAVVAVEGNFDDAQTGVKEIFGNKVFNAELDGKGLQFSSANSINIGRLFPQVAYYVYAYTRLVNKGEIKNGEPMNICVPTGNFGNILAGYFAKLIGVPIKKFICASNDNKVLFDFIETGVYDRNREFQLTISPSMDILISSNLERLLLLLADNDTDKIAELMDALSNEGVYQISDQMKEGLKDFYGNFITTDETYDVIKKVFEEDQYLIDTHTAVGTGVYNKYKAATNDHTKTVIVSTASPYKFTRSVMNAIDEKYDCFDDFELTKKMNELTGGELPKAILDILEAPVRHTRECKKDKMKEEIKNILGV